MASTTSNSSGFDSTPLSARCRCSHCSIGLSAPLCRGGGQGGGRGGQARATACCAKDPAGGWQAQNSRAAPTCSPHSQASIAHTPQPAPPTHLHLLYERCRQAAAQHIIPLLHRDGVCGGWSSGNAGPGRAVSNASQPAGAQRSTAEQGISPSASQAACSGSQGEVRTGGTPATSAIPNLAGSVPGKPAGVQGREASGGRCAEQQDALARVRPLLCPCTHADHQGPSSSPASLPAPLTRVKCHRGAVARQGGLCSLADRGHLHSLNLVLRRRHGSRRVWR